MKSETMLPLGKVDPGLREPDTPLDVRTIAEGAALVEALGYDGLAVEECKDDPYQQLALASVNTTELSLATSIAMADTSSKYANAATNYELRTTTTTIILGIAHAHFFSHNFIDIGGSIVFPLITVPAYNRHSQKPL